SATLPRIRTSITRPRAPTRRWARSITRSSRSPRRSSTTTSTPRRWRPTATSRRSRAIRDSRRCSWTGARAAPISTRPQDGARVLVCRLRSLFVVMPAHRGVVLVRTELDLRPDDGRRAVDEAQVADRLLRAVLAGDLDLLDPVGELHQALRAGEQPGLEVGAQ